MAPEKASAQEVFASWRGFVCHRGYHDLKRPENSLTAFEAAISRGYAFETDVHLSKDGALLLSHDSSLLRLTGKEGIIEELTLEEIKANYRLPDGSALPTLGELFSLWGEKCPMVLELKPYGGDELPLAKAVSLFLGEHLKDASKLALISFSEKALAPFLGGRINLGLLIGEKEDAFYFHRHSHDIKPWDFLDVYVGLLPLPMFQSYRKKGKPILSWTIRDEKDFKKAKRYSDSLTLEEVDSSKPKEEREEDPFLHDFLLSPKA